MSISVQLSLDFKPYPDSNNLGFGKYFADHMFCMDFVSEDGWVNPKIIPYSEFKVSPSNLTFHYGQTVFEGLKAFKWKDGSVNIFRLNDHIKRLAHSAERLCIPKFNEELVIEACKLLVDIDNNWVPKSEGTSLYLRPIIMADDDALGVRPSNNYKLFIITSPVGNYYSKGHAPTKILVEESYARVAHGGLGEAKTAANYAASLLAAEKAKSIGYDQVLWLDSINHEYIEEVGTMNIFFVLNGTNGDTLVTPPLDGTILHGITRKTVLEIAREWGVNVEERLITIADISNAFDNGTLKEVFGSGTAAVISQVGELSYKGKNMIIIEQPNSLRSRLFDAISNIQHGIESDNFNRLTKIEHHNFDRSKLRKDSIDDLKFVQDVIEVKSRLAH
ncbi:MAG: branched-chain amino acid aminotransferase [Chlorobi bacterium]|nr:branched-chain amino acid aminotransferase [Chlorobiota bacterium]